MNADELNIQITKIDYRLSTQNKSVSERIDIVKGELCPDMNDLINTCNTLNTEELDRLLSTLQVDNWYREKYAFATSSKSIKEKPFFLQGDIYYFIFTEKMEDSLMINYTNLPEIVKKNLTKLEIEYLQNSFKNARRKLPVVKSLEDVVLFCDQRNNKANDIINQVPDELKNSFYLSVETIEFIRFAIEDFNLAIVTLKNTSNYQFVIFPASQAIEKLLKACLIEAELKISGKTSQELRKYVKEKYGHRLLDMLTDLNYYLKNTSNIETELRKFPYAEEMFKKNPNQGINRNLGKSPINPRYDVMEISSEQAVEIIDATLNIFELVSEQFITHLQRAMYYPVLEKGYDEYYDQLEDKDLFLE